MSRADSQTTEPGLRWQLDKEGSMSDTRQVAWQMVEGGVELLDE